MFGDFYSDLNQRNKTGLQSRCKACQKIASTEYGRAHPEWSRKQALLYRSRHPERVKITEEKKREKRPEHYKMLAKKRTARYRQRNPGISLKGNAERLRRWRKLHPEREASTQAARRVLIKSIPSWGDKALIETVYAKAKAYGFEVDHIVPLKHPLVCGLHVWANLQLLSRRLNRSKNNHSWPDMPTED